MKITKSSFIYSIIIILLPFFYFLESNIKNFNSEYYIAFFLLIIISIFVSSILGLVLIRFFNDKNSEKFLLFSMFNFIMIIFFSYLYSYFNNIFFDNRAEIVFLICFCLFSILIFSSKLKKFFLFFCIISFILTIGKILYLETNNNISNKKIVSKLIYENFKISSKKDIYIIIFDGAISLDEFDEIYNLNVKEKFLENLPKEYIYHKNIKALSNNSGESIEKIFNFNSRDVNKRLLNFPKILKSSYFKNTDLKKFINMNNLNFYFFGNSTVNCSIYNINTCPDKERNKAKIYFFYLNEILEEFNNHTFFKMLKDKVYRKFTLEERLDIKILKLRHEMNIPLLNFSFKEFNKNEKNNIFFFYNFLPHEPYFYDKNCEFKKNKYNYNLNYFDGYKDNYLCMIKTINEFFDKNNQNLKQAKVIILADHGFPLKDINKKKKHNYSPLIKTVIDKNQNIFMITNKHEKCKIKLNAGTQNVNSLLIKTLKC